MKIGFVINPLAGMGGSVALKGSDGQNIVEEARVRGAVPQSESRAEICLHHITESSLHNLSFLTAAGEMGANLLQSLHFNMQTVYCPGRDDEQTSAIDTKAAVEEFLQSSVDLIVFTGGDGTARDVLDVLEQAPKPVPVIGVPAGVKIHSAVYALTPKHAGELIDLLLQGVPMSVQDAMVMDLDEEAFRKGKVNAKCYGYLPVPVDDTRMQLIKQGGLNHHDIAVQDIATDIIERMEDDVVYLVGSGTTTAEIMNQLMLDNTLLGIDAVCNQQLLASDVDEQAILELMEQHKVRIIITIIGGQGHIFGRGNQQFSSEVIRCLVENQSHRENILLVATNEKLRSLNGRPMIADTGDEQLDQQLQGLYSVITGYQQRTLYRVN